MSKLPVIPVGEVVVLGLRGSPVGALGMWNGTQWYIWRKTNAGMTGEPNNWHPVEGMLVVGWAAIPPGFLHTVIPDGAGPHERVIVDNPAEPWRLMMATTPASRRILDDYDRERQPAVARVVLKGRRSPPLAELAHELSCAETKRGGTVRSRARAVVKRGQLNRVHGKIVER